MRSSDEVEAILPWTMNARYGVSYCGSSTKTDGAQSGQ